MGKQTDVNLMGGCLLPVCSRCASLVLTRFCGRCGERFQDGDDTVWFRIQVESTARRTVDEAARLLGYPGAVERVGARQTLSVGAASQVDWLRSHAPRLLAMRNSAILAPGGRKIASADPVYACAMGVMASGIRGCMTQKARVAHCGFESTILPLRESMRALSLADQLVGLGRKDLSQELVIGLLAGLHRKGQKVYCPLFGRGLRLTAADIKELPDRVAAALASAKGAPRLRPMAESAALPVQHPQAPPGEAGNAVRLALALRQRKLAVHPRAAGAYDGVEHVAGTLVLRFTTDLQQRMVDVVATAADEQMGKRLSLQADDIDIHGNGLAVLRVDKLQIQITDLIAGSDFVGAWQGGALPEGVGWRIRRWGSGWYWVWNDAGALFLLTPERGWLFTSLSGEARALGTVPQSDQYSAVVGVARCGNESFILSAGGHRLTLAAARCEALPAGQPPLRAKRDLILPQAARALGLGLGSKVILHDDDLAYGIDADAASAEVFGTIAAGVRPSLLGGHVVCEGASEVSLLGPGPVAEGPSWAQLEMLLRQATERRPNVETWAILDRQGRPPHRTTWGG